MLTLLNSDIARQNLRHSNTNGRNRSNIRVISLDEDDGSGSYGGQVCLCGNDTHVIDVGMVVVGVRCAVNRGSE